MHNNVYELDEVPDQLAYDLIDYFVGNDCRIEYIEVYCIGSYDFAAYVDESTNMFRSYDLSGLSAETIKSIEELFDKVPDMEKAEDWLFTFLVDHSDMSL